MFNFKKTLLQCCVIIFMGCSFCIANNDENDLVQYMKNCDIQRFIPSGEILVYLAQHTVPYTTVTDVNELNSIVVLEFNIDDYIEDEPVSNYYEFSVGNMDDFDNAPLIFRQFGVAGFEQSLIPNINAQYGLDRIYEDFEETRDKPVAIFGIYKTLTPAKEMIFYYTIEMKMKYYNQYLYTPSTDETEFGANNVSGWFNINFW